MKKMMRKGRRIPFTEADEIEEKDVSVGEDAPEEEEEVGHELDESLIRLLLTSHLHISVRMTSARLLRFNC